MSWTPPPLDPTPYGIDLATRVATCLNQGHELSYGHRDYCGMGLVFQEGHYCYDEVNDGRMPRLRDILQPDNTIGRSFAKRGDFIAWFAAQSDTSLARLDAPNEFYHRNQTIDRDRLTEFVAKIESVPLVTLARWTHLWKSIPATTGEATPWYHYIFSFYSEPERHYHNVQHINDCLLEFDTVSHQAKQPAALEAALWFHDIVYHPQESNNEEVSARIADKVLIKGKISKTFIRHVRDLIMATRDHQPKDTVPDSDLICDIDLAILGQSEKRFQEYEAAIRQEYAHVPAETFNPKRAEILTQFLQRPAIYQTETFRSRYETTARKNLEQSIRHLTTPAPKKRKWFGLF